MKKKSLNMMLAVFLTAGILCGCQKTNGQSDAQDGQPSEVQAVQEELDQPALEEQNAQEDAGEAEKEDTSDARERVTVRIASLKGPTTMGLVKLWQQQEDGSNQGDYEFMMMTGADEIMPQMIKGEVDIALLPANAAAILYGKSQGAVAVIDINTLGVLYLVSGDETIETVADLAGKTIYLTGKGTTPDYGLQYLLAKHGIDLSEVTLEYRSEATEVAVLLKENPDSIGLLPQPFVTAACMQNEDLDRKSTRLNSSHP